MICPDDLDIEAFMEALDPDWRDHFLTVDDAFAFYWKYLDPAERQQAMKESQ